MLNEAQPPGWVPAPPQLKTVLPPGATGNLRQNHPSLSSWDFRRVSWAWGARQMAGESESISTEGDAEIAGEDGGHEAALSFVLLTPARLRNLVPVCPFSGPRSSAFWLQGGDAWAAVQSRLPVFRGEQGRPRGARKGWEERWAEGVWPERETGVTMGAGEEEEDRRSLPSHVCTIRECGQGFGWFG